MRFFIIFILFTQLGFSQKKGTLPSWVTNSNVKHPDFNSDEYISGDVVSIKYNSKKELEEAKRKAKYHAESNISKVYSISSGKDTLDRKFKEREKNINGKIKFSSEDNYLNKTTLTRQRFGLIGLVPRIFVDTKKRTVYAVAAFNAYKTKKLHKSKIDKLKKNITENINYAENSILKYKQSERVSYKAKAINAYDIAIKSLKEIEKNNELYNVLNLDYNIGISLNSVIILKTDLFKTVLNLDDFAFTVSETLKSELGKKEEVIAYPAILEEYGKSTPFSLYLNKLIIKQLSSNSKPWKVLSKRTNNNVKYKVRSTYKMVVGKDSVINYKLTVFESKNDISVFDPTFELSNTLLRNEGFAYIDKGKEEFHNESEKISDKTKEFAFDAKINIYEDNIRLSQDVEIVFKQGKNYTFTMSTNKSGYLRLVYVEQDGDLALLIDSHPFKIKPNEITPIPFNFGVGPPFGNETLRFLISEEEFPWEKTLKRIGNIRYIKKGSKSKRTTRDVNGGLSKKTKSDNVEVYSFSIKSTKGETLD
jgi:hypothetical protein